VLQELVRRPPVEDTALYVNHFVVDNEGTDTTPTSIGLLAEKSVLYGASRRR